jgi:hypothetical protein
MSELLQAALRYAKHRCPVFPTNEAKHPRTKNGLTDATSDPETIARRQAERALEGPLSREEAELLLAKAARKGSVPALRLWFEQRAAGDSKQRGDEARRLLESVFGSDDGR